MWRKREIMELQSKTMMQEFIDNVPTDVSGKWVNKDELKKFGEFIVKECSEIASEAEPYKASDLIKKHFGYNL